MTLELNITSSLTLILTSNLEVSGDGFFDTETINKINKTKEYCNAI